MPILDSPLVGKAIDLGIDAIERIRERRRSRGQPVDAPLTEAERTEATFSAGTAAARDPVVVNNANLEPKTESRVVMGSATAFGGGLIMTIKGIIDLFAVFDGVGFGEPGFWPALVTFLFGAGAAGGGLFSLVGRLRDNLPPMHFRWFNPLSWLARRKSAVAADPTGSVL